MWVWMLVVDVRVVFVAMDHGLVSMPVRVLGRSWRSIGMNMSVVLIMGVLVAVL